MKNNVIDNGLDDVVSVGLTCLEQRLDSKAAVKSSILSYVKENYIAVEDILTVEDLPISLLELMNKQLNIAFEVNDGEVSAVVTERPAQEQKKKRGKLGTLIASTLQGGF